MARDGFSSRTADGADVPDRPPERQDPGRRRGRRRRPEPEPYGPDPAEPDGFPRRGVVGADADIVLNPDPVEAGLDVTRPVASDLDAGMLGDIAGLDRIQSAATPDPGLPDPRVERELTDADYLDGAEIDREITDWDIPLDVPHPGGRF